MLSFTNSTKNVRKETVITPDVKTDYWKYNGEKIKLDSKTKTIATKKEKFGYNSVFGSIAVNKGKHLWKLEVTKVTKKMCIGISSSIETIEQNFHKQPAYAHYAYTSNGMKICQNMKYELYGLMIKSGDVITVILDLNQGQISFMNNSNDLGIAYEDIERGRHISYRVAVSVLDKNDCVKLIGYGQMDEDEDEVDDEKYFDSNEMDCKDMESWNKEMVKSFIGTVVKDKRLNDMNGSDLKEIVNEINKNSQEMAKYDALLIRFDEIKRQRDKLEVKSNELNKKFEASEMKKNEYLHKVMLLNEENEQSYSLREEVTAKFDELKLRYETVLNISEKDKMKLNEFEKEAKALKINNDENLKQISELQTEKDELSMIAKERKRKIEKYADKNAKNEQIINDLKIRCNEMEVSKKAKEEKMNNLSDENVSNKEMIDTLEAELNLINIQYQTSTERNKALDNKFNRCFKEKMELKIKCDALADQKEKITKHHQSILDEMKAEMEISNAKNAQIQDEKQRLTTQIEQLSVKNNELSKKYDEFRATKDAEIGLLKKEQTLNKDCIAALKRDLVNARKSHDAEIKKMHNDSSDKYRLLTNEKEEMIKGHTIVLDEMTQKMEALNAKHIELERDFEKKQRQLTNQSEVFEERIKGIERINDQKMKISESKIVAMEKDLIAQRKVKEEVELRLVELTKKCTQLAKERTDAMEEYKNEMDKKEKTMNEIQIKYVDLFGKNTKLQQLFDAVSEEKAEADKQIKSLVEELDESKQNEESQREMSRKNQAQFETYKQENEKELAKLIERNRAVQSELEKEENLKQAQSEKCKQITKNLNDIKLQNAKHEKEIASLNKSNEQLSEERDKLLADHKSMVDESTKQRRCLIASNDALQTKNKENDDLKSKMNNLEKDAKEYLEQIKSMKSAQVTARKEHEKKINDLNGTYNALEKECSDMKTRYEALNNENDALRLEHDESIQTIKNLKKQTEHSAQNRTELESKLKEYEILNETIEKTMNELKTRCDVTEAAEKQSEIAFKKMKFEMTEKLQNANAKNVELNTEIERHLKEIELLNATSSAATGNHERSFAILNSKLENLQVRYEELEKEKNRAKLENDECAEQINQLKNKNKALSESTVQLQSKCKENNEVIHSLNEQCNKYGTQSDEKEQVIIKHQNTVNELREKIRNANAENIELKAKFGQQKSVIESKEEEIALSNQKHEKLRDELKLKYEALFKASEKDKMNITKLEQNIKTLTVKSDENIKQIRDLQSEKDFLTQNANQWDSKLKEYETINAENEKVINDLKIKCDEMKTSQKQNKEECNKLNEENKRKIKEQQIAMDKMTKTLKIANTKITELNEQHKQLTAANDVRIGKLENKLTASQKENGDLIKQKKELLLKTDEFKWKLDESAKEITELNEKCQKIEVKVKEMTVKNDALNIEKLALSERVKEFESTKNELKSMQKQRQKWFVNQQELVQKIKALTDQNEKTSQKLNEESIKSNDETKLNNENISKLESLLNEYDDDANLKETLTKLLKESQLKHEEYEDLLEERDALKNKNSKIKKKLKQANKEKDTLLALYEEKEKEFELLRQQRKNDPADIKGTNKKLKKRSKKSTGKSKRTIVFDES